MNGHLEKNKMLRDRDDNPNVQQTCQIDILPNWITTFMREGLPVT